MILPIDEELARVFVAAYEGLRDAPENERMPRALAAVRGYLERRVDEKPRASAQRIKRRRARLSHSQRRREAWTVLPFIEATAASFGLTVSDLTGASRIGRIARARAYAMWVIREATGLSYPLIGVAFSGRDHSTVIAAVRKAAGLVAADEVLAARLRALAVGPAAGERAA